MDQRSRPRNEEAETINLVVPAYQVRGDLENLISAGRELRRGADELKNRPDMPPVTEGHHKRYPDLPGLPLTTRDEPPYSVEELEELAELKTELKRRIEQDLKAEANTHSMLAAQLLSRANVWDSHVAELLGIWFSSTRVAEEFVIARSKVDYEDVQFQGKARAADVYHALDGQLDFLVALQQRLPVYDARRLRSERSRSSTTNVYLEPRSFAMHVTQYNINAPIGQLNSGERQLILSINTHLAGVVQQGDSQVAEALQKVSEAALVDPQLD